MYSSFFRPLGLFLVLTAATAFAARPTERYNGRDVVSDEVIVKLKNSDPATLARIHAFLDAATSARLSQAVPLFAVHSRSKNVQMLLTVLAALPDVVEYAEPNYMVHTQAAPNDTSFTSLWALSNTGQNILGTPGRGGADISASLAWDISTGSTANVVGVIDTGVDYNHPDLAANMWSAPAAFTVTLDGAPVSCPAGSHGFNAIANSCDPMDDHSHGTHVSGTIGATGNNSMGVVGVNWRTRILGLKFMDASGSGSVGDAIKAIDFAIQVKTRFGSQANVRVLSNSWGGDGYSQALADAITRAHNADMLFVAAAGNGSQNNDLTPSYPANFALPNVVTVAATDNQDALADFSNYGANSVHIGAPGVGILSTTPGANYAWKTGTSMATPHVAGAAMLVISQCALTTAALRSLLLNNTDADPALTGKTTTGGRLNVNRALRACAAPVSAAQSSAVFVKTDVSTQGSWKLAYGVEGYSVPNEATQLPAYAQVATATATWTWTPSTTDVRAVQETTGADRIASTWYGGTFSYDVNLTDGNAHQVAVYALDWDAGSRAERVEVLDAASGAVLDTRDVSLFSNGLYLVWNVKGHVMIRVTRTGGANAVISGVFFGSGGTAVTTPAILGPAASFVRVDTTTRGSWSGVYGRDGFEIVNSTKSYPAYATTNANAAATWTWSGTTTDGRALQKPGAGDRIAACWYGGTYSFDVNLTDGAMHQVALYLLDWDNNGRSQRVDVLDGVSGTVLDTRPVSGFGAGQYLVWNVSGHVQIRVTLLGGPNAVVSGLFFN